MGQLGIGTLLDSAVPVVVPGLLARAISAGENHTCAILLDGGVKCWGFNGFGQLGNGEFANAPAPKDVTTSVQEVFLGENHTCALMIGGGMKCWGSNVFSQLGGNEINKSEFSPVDVFLDGVSVTGIGTGGDHTCALLSGGTVKCWGRNRDGQLGIASKGEVPQTTPFLIQGFSSVEGISGGGDHTCAISVVATTGTGTSTATSTKEVSCWGKNTSGQLGTGSIADATIPTVSLLNLPPTVTPTKISAGDKHTCSLLSDGTVRCWGFNKSGQLGDGFLTDSFTPRVVQDPIAGPPSLVGATDVSVGGGHTCVVLTGGSVKCWGSNSFGQLGVAGVLSTSVPQKITVLGFKNVAAGDHHTCGLLDNATVRCWGSNESGQLGNEKNVSASTPEPIKGLLTYQSVSAGKNHTCAVTIDNTLKCWGDNAYGQLGTGIAGFRATPVSVIGFLF